MNKKKKYQFLGILLACDLLSYIFTFFRGSEVYLERCDSYGNFGYLKKSNIFILREILKRKHCPSIGTLALLLFLPCLVLYLGSYLSIFVDINPKVT